RFRKVPGERRERSDAARAERAAWSQRTPIHAAARRKCPASGGAVSRWMPRPVQSDPSSRGTSSGLELETSVSPDPKRIGPYRILGVLGSGGRGVVYKAQHEPTGRQAALKTVRVPHESMLQGIRREVQALARIEHPGIVRILDMGLHEGMPWYAMELVPGPSLRLLAAQLRQRLPSSEPTTTQPGASRGRTATQIP